MTLRLAISGTGADHIHVDVNGRDAGTVDLGPGDSTFGGRNGIQGIWYERKLPFDAFSNVSDDTAQNYINALDSY